MPQNYKYLANREKLSPKPLPGAKEQNPTWQNRQVEADIEPVVGAANATPVDARVAAPQPCHCHREGAIVGDIPQGHPAPVLARGGAAGGDDGVADPVCCYFAPIFPLVFVGRGGGVEAAVGDGAPEPSCQEPGAVQAAGDGLCGHTNEDLVTPRQPAEPQQGSFQAGLRFWAAPGSENLFGLWCFPSLSALGFTEPLARIGRPSQDPPPTAQIAPWS